MISSPRSRYQPTAVERVAAYAIALARQLNVSFLGSHSQAPIQGMLSSVYLEWKANTHPPKLRRFYHSDFDSLTWSAACAAPERGLSDQPRFCFKKTPHRDDQLRQYAAHGKLVLLYLAHRDASRWSDDEGHELERYHAKSSTCGLEGVRDIQATWSTTRDNYC